MLESIIVNRSEIAISDTEIPGKDAALNSQRVGERACGRSLQLAPKLSSDISWRGYVHA